MLNVLSLTVPLFIIIIISYVLRRARFFPEDFARSLNRFVYYVAMPLMLFDKMSGMDPCRLLDGRLYLGYPLILLLMAFIAVLLSFRMRPALRGAFIQAVYRGNMAYLGIPIVLAVLGEEIFAVLAVTVGLSSIINISVAIAVLKYFAPEQSGLDIGRRLRSVLLNPLIIGIVLGIVVSFIPNPLPSAAAAMLKTVISFFSRTALPLILVVIGLSLSFQDIRRRGGVSTAVAGLKLIAMPLLAYGLLYTLGFRGSLLQVIVLLAAMPTALSSLTFAKEFHADVEVTASMINMNTLAAMVTVPLWIIALRILPT